MSASCLSIIVPPLPLNMQENSQVVIKIPELLTAIVHRLDAPDQRKLMLVSNYFFYSVGPMVWKRVPRVDFLMRLIKGTIVDPLTVILPRLFRYKILVTLPPDPDLGRYNIYAPWVQEIGFFGGRILQEIGNPNRLLTLLDGRPLLPNLNRITVYSIIPITEDSIKLVNLFMNLSLKEIRTVLHKKDERGIVRSFPMPWSSARIFINHIEQTCPQLGMLEFYPEADWGGISRPRGQCRRALSSFLNLRSFSSTTCMLETATLGALGQLLYLESLTVRGPGGASPVLDKRLSIPGTWFPSLKELRLYDMNYEDIQVLWKQPTIIKKLVSVLIQVGLCDSRVATRIILDEQSWVGPFLAAVPRLSPQLQDVAFYIGND